MIVLAIGETQENRMGDRSGQTVAAEAPEGLCGGWGADTPCVAELLVGAELGLLCAWFGSVAASVPGAHLGQGVLWWSQDGSTAEEALPILGWGRPLLVQWPESW